MIRTLDIAWVAGFLEGEGNFHADELRSVSISASQVQRAPLERLQALFGVAFY